MLRPETVAQLREALLLQRHAADGEPVPALRNAIHQAATEARERSVPAESLLIQLKELSVLAGTSGPAADPVADRDLREWIVAACLRAYWDTRAE